LEISWEKKVVAGGDEIGSWVVVVGACGDE